jgi:aldose 1-epimerase
MMHITKEKKLTSVGSIDLVTLKTDTMEVILTSYGAAVYQIWVHGHLVSVQPLDLNTFLSAKYYYGKTVGRTSGRLILPDFQIDQNIYPISEHRGEGVKLHGGPRGFSFRNFSIVKERILSEEVMVQFKYESKHLEEEYPGNLTLFVTYHLTKSQGLLIDFDATSDQDTLCNITNHLYFNLSTKRSDVLDHVMQINANQYLEIDDLLKPKQKTDVNGLPFDFRIEKHLGKQMELMKDTSFEGFDHTWLLTGALPSVVVDEPSSPVKLICETDYPAVVIFTHNQPSPDGLPQFKTDGKHSAFTLECQFEPGGIHFPFLNAAILRKNEKYHHYIRYQFVDKA